MLYSDAHTYTISEAMKPSIYNSYFNFSDGIQMIYNAHTDKFVVFNNHVIINQDNITDPNINKKLKEDLYSSGCVVDTKINELAVLREEIFRAHSEGDYFHLTINPTLNCNFKCWYCYENHKVDSKMSPETIESIVKLIGNSISKKNNYKKVLLSFFGGEPLMYFGDTVQPLIVRANHSCKQYGKDLDVHFTSNAYLLNDAIISFLSNYCCSFQITLDGHRDRHNSVRHSSSSSSYDTIITNIKKLIEAGIRVLVRINCTESNVKDLGCILSDFNDIQSDGKNLISFDFQRVWQDINPDINSESESSFNDKIIEFVKLYRETGFHVNSVIIFDRIKNCCYGDKLHHATINYNGDVYQCTARDFNETNRMGKLCPDGRIEWDKMTISERNSHKFSDPVCHLCRIAPICGGGCSQNSIERRHNGRCPFGYTEEKIDEIILTRFRYMYMA